MKSSKIIPLELLVLDFVSVVFFGGGLDDLIRLCLEKWFEICPHLTGDNYEKKD